MFLRFKSVLSGCQVLHKSMMSSYNVCLLHGRHSIGHNLLIEAVCSSKYNNFRCICAGSGAQISERVITVYFSLNCREMFNLHTKVAGIFDIKTAHF